MRETEAREEFDPFEGIFIHIDRPGDGQPGQAFGLGQGRQAEVGQIVDDLSLLDDGHVGQDFVFDLLTE